IGFAEAQAIHSPPVLQAPPPHTPTQILVVDASGGGNYLRIKDAVNAALDGAWIQVKAGTYVENSINFAYKNLELESIDCIGMAIVNAVTSPGSSKTIFILEHFQTPASVINGFKL